MCKSATHPGRALPALIAALLLGVLLAGCSDCSDGSAGFCDESDVSYSSPDEVPCSSLGEKACEHASHCVLDSVCASSAACSSTGCSETCDLVRVCVPYD